jgi:DNA-directed RNA polymerase specialized sigma24 family protein
MGSLPFEFPKTESRFIAKVRTTARALRRKFGLAVPATDIVHEVMLEAMAEQAQAGSEAKGFWRRLVNKVFDNYRRERAHRRMIGRRAAAQQGTVRKGTGGGMGEEIAVGSELRGEISRLVAELSENDQEIWRRLGVSESYADIAGAMGKSPEAVKQAAYRIRAHVRSRLPHEYR